MRKNTLLLLAAVFILMVVSVACVSAYSNTLNWNSSENQLDAAGSWASMNTSMNWEVTYNTASNHWLYKYTLRVASSPSISHLIIETSPNFTYDDIKSIGYTSGSYSSYEIGNFLSTKKSNPNMPSNLYGIKFDGTTGSALSVYFETDRAPVWGDFYAKGGNDKSVFNTGFTANDKDPLSPYTANVPDHILRPDTIVGGPNGMPTVPEPSSMLVLFSGLATVLGGIKLRRTK